MMTFLEKYKKDHPNDNVDSLLEYFCPCDFGYENKIECKLRENKDKYACARCWEREMPGTENELIITEDDLKTAYNSGLEDAWELAKRLHLDKCDYKYSLDENEIREIYSTPDLAEVMSLSPQEAMEKLKAYEESQKIRVGDVVEQISSGKLFLVITNEYNRPHRFGVIKLESLTIDRITGDSQCFKKTGEHVDIESILSQIGGN